ncbi:piggyBac transposable element-derived protein 4-like [Teleopsis dalmanni]|uniref:piggyBac transposable element-derived protein 4-like n=1 Tax=Teleopsis dalmanni TaxID=139649 RepID=UPI0018CF99D4|nr:piggyBac transposable element-derived protein 4-like [Teleopsis dalmanni]
METLKDDEIVAFLSDFDDEASDDGDPDFEPELLQRNISEDDMDTDVELSKEIEIPLEQNNYFCKDGNIKWTTIPPNGRELLRATNENVIHERTGVTAYAVQRISEIRDSFDLCITTTMKKEIIRYSNMQGNAVYENFHCMDEIEFDAYLGLLMLIGVYRSYGESISCLWNENHGRPLLRAVMTLERFTIISRVLAFDNRQARRSQVRGHKLAPIRSFYEKWTKNLQVLYVPNENITVDEQLIPFRGRCPFKVYMPSKPGKYGMKAWIAADSATAFCLQFQIYLGKTSDLPERNQGERVVLDLVSQYTGRNVTTDNFFTSHNLAQELLKRKITLVGTVRKNKRFLPVHCTVKELRKLPIYTSKFFFHEKETIVQYVPKRYKIVTLLSGVDTMDQMVRTYSCKRKTNRWPVALFSNLIDISALNAFILWTEINPNWQSRKLCKRRIFLQELGESLVQPCILQRNHMPRSEASAALVRNVQHEYETPSMSLEPPPKILRSSERKRCQLCPSKQEKKTHTKCNVCHKFVCPTHRETKTITTTFCIDHKQ